MGSKLGVHGHFFVKVILFANIYVSIYRIAFIFYIQYFCKKKNYFKFRRFRLVLRFLVKVFEYSYISVTINDIAFIFCIQLPKDLSNTLHKNILHHICYSIPTILSKNCYSQFTHFSMGVDLEFFTTIFKLLFF